MAGISTYSRDTFLGWVAGAGTTGAPGSLHISLNTQAGDGITDGTERQNITFTLDAANNRLDSNVEVLFNSWNGGTTSFDRFSVWDSGVPNSGNRIFFGNLSSVLTLNNGERAKIAAGDCYLDEVSGTFSDTYIEYFLNWVNGIDLTGTVSLTTEIREGGGLVATQPMPAIVTNQILQNNAQVNWGVLSGSGVIDEVLIRDNSTQVVSTKSESFAYSNNDEAVAGAGALQFTIL